MIDSSSYEDDLNLLLDKLSKTISTFNTLSREQAEIAILDTTNKIKDGESILSKIEEELENNTNNHSPEELLEEKKKIKNYKTEFNNIVNKFNIIQNNYINRKAKNALIDEEPKGKNFDLLSNEERKNDNEEKSKEQLKNKNLSNSANKNEQNVFENNIGNLSGVNGNPNITDDAFDNFSKNKSIRKKRCLIIGLIVTFILIITFIVVIGIEAHKK
jgi:hypothetical protein